jgi:hypothetical protein
MQWEKMSRKWRAVAWGRLCSTYVKRLEPLLAKCARKARSKQLAASECKARRLALQQLRSTGTASVQRRGRISRKVCEVAPLRLRRVSAVSSPRIRRLSVATHAPGTNAYPTEADRRLRHIRSQRRRSQRRAQLLGIRMEWARRRDEKTAASDDLWQFATEDDSPRKSDRDLSAWPRLDRREREQLAHEVESFAKTSR